MRPKQPGRNVSANSREKKFKNLLLPVGDLPIVSDVRATFKSLRSV